MLTCRYVLCIDNGDAYTNELNRCGKAATHITAGMVRVCDEHAQAKEFEGRVWKLDSNNQDNG